MGGEKRKKKKNPPWFTSDWGAVHDLVLCDGVVLVVDVWPHAGGLPLDDVDLHVPDLDPHQQKVDLAYDHVFQVVSAPNQRRGRQTSRHDCYCDEQA